MSALNVAVGATVVIALLQAGSAYLNAFYTVKVGQWIAHDLRRSVYAHLQRLSMSYYDKQRVGPLISTITDDINEVQEFASTSLLDILVDGQHVVSGVSRDQIRIPAKGIGEIPLRARVGYSQLRSIWREVTNAVQGDRARYEVKGRAYYDTPIGQLNVPVTIYQSR